MKPLRRLTSAARSATADLFADGYADVAVSPVHQRLPTNAARLATPSTARHLRQPRLQQLWYAAVFPELRDPHAPSTLQRLARCAQRFTSLVSIETPNALLLEIKGSVTLFGSLAALYADLDAAWSRLALSVMTAVAPTTLGALWLARAGQNACIEEAGALAAALAEVPLACTAWHPDRLRTLHSMGVTRIGELLRLPRAGLARRLGPSAVVDIDIALARQAAPRRAFVPRERFRERCDCESEIETVVLLQQAVQPLIEHCAQFLRERQAGVQALELRLWHRTLTDTRIHLGLANITGERGRLADVLEEKLHRLELPAPVKGMELRSGSLQPLSAASLDAFAGLRSGGRDTAPQLVERLSARFGETAVYGVATIAEHRPEAAWRRVHALRLIAARTDDLRAGDVSTGKGRERGGDADMARPVWLLAEPVMLCAMDPQHTQPLGWILDEGPERIESGWWDGKGVARDYYVARQMPGARQMHDAPQMYGARAWIFQERRTRGWYLHGVFA